MKLLIFLSVVFLFPGCDFSKKRSSNEKLEMKAYEAANSGQYDIAAKYYDELILRDSLYGPYFFGRGVSYMNLYRKDKAVESFTKSIELKYKKTSCYYNLGLMNTFTNDSLALIYFGKALNTDSTRHDIRKEFEECRDRLKTKSTY